MEPGKGEIIKGLPSPREQLGDAEAEIQPELVEERRFT